MEPKGGDARNVSPGVGDITSSCCAGVEGRYISYLYVDLTTRRRSKRLLRRNRRLALCRSREASLIPNYTRIKRRWNIRTISAEFGSLTVTSVPSEATLGSSLASQTSAARRAKRLVCPSRYRGCIMCTSRRYGNYPYQNQPYVREKYAATKYVEQVYLLLVISREKMR